MKPRRTTLKMQGCNENQCTSDKCDPPLCTEEEQSLLFIAYHALIEYPFKIKAEDKIFVSDLNDEQEPGTQKLKYYLYQDVFHASFFCLLFTALFIHE